MSFCKNQEGKYKLYNLNVSLIKEWYFKDCKIHIEGLKSGVYILKTSNKTYKILVGGVKWFT